MTADKGGRSLQRAKAGEADRLGVNAEIGRRLKQYYDGIVSEEVPQRFTELLNQLEDSEDRAQTRRGE